MNARFATKVRVGLTMTVMALCGAMALSGNTGCASSDSSSGGSNSNGGSAGGAGGTSTTPSNGGSNGGGSCTPGADSVCFAAGKASGVMTGYGYIALGAADTATSPVCDNTANGGTATDPITSANPCPETGGKSVWSTPAVGLCISGSIPAVTGGDYTGNWGLQIGCNVSDPAGSTIGTAYSKITFNFNESAISPKNSGLRGEIHVKGDAADKTYCAAISSGVATSLIAFSTQCWGGTDDKPLSADQIPNIDKIGVQISSDTGSKYDVKDFCWTGVSFTK